MKFWKLFAICPFWQRTRKTASTAPRTSLWRHSGRTPQRRIRATPWRSAAFAPSTTPAPPHSAALAPFHTIAPVPLHDAGYASSHHAVPAPIRNTAPVPLHGAVRVSTQGAVPAPHHAAKPHAAHSTALGASPPSALLQSCRKSGNKKVIKIATFLRLAIAADVQITDRAPKIKQATAQCLISTLRETRKSRKSQKSCKSARIFVFVRRITATGADSVMSQSPNGGKSRDELIAATRRTPHE